MGLEILVCHAGGAGVQSVHGHGGGFELVVGQRQRVGRVALGRLDEESPEVKSSIPQSREHEDTKRNDEPQITETTDTKLRM